MAIWKERNKVTGARHAVPLPDAAWPTWIQSMAEQGAAAPADTMLPTLPAVSLKLSELFASPFQFSVPTYQRLYSWTVKEAGQLLDDLMTAAGVAGGEAGEPDYFLSSIVLLSLSANGPPGLGRGGESVFEIVDGQQRLVTVTLLAAVLRNLETDVNSETSARLHALVIASQRAASGAATRIRLELRGRDHSYFERLVQSSVDRADSPAADPANVGERNLLQVFEHLTSELSQLEEGERRQLARYMCDCCHFVVIFTKDIDRAHRLFTILNERGRPLQRNDILKAEVLHRVAPGRAPAAALAWDHAAELLGAEFESLFGHIRTIRGKKKTQIIVGIRSIMAELGGAENFIEDELCPLANSYYVVLNASDPFLRIDEQLRGHLVALGRLRSSDWMPAALLVLKQHGNDLPRARALMREIERYAYLLRVLCLGSAKRLTRFAAVCASIQRGEALGPGSQTFRLSKEELRTIEFHLRDFHRRNAAVCKVLLLRLNDAMESGPTLVDPSSLSIEHVLPLKPSQTSEWRRTFPDTAERAACTECLGNLVLVSQRQNHRARNQDFGHKQAIYSTNEEGIPVLAVTRDMAAAERWTAAEIRAREGRLLALLAGIWELDLKGAATAAAAPETGRGMSLAS